MADKEFIKKYKLSEAVKRFNQINEYTFISSPPLTEDGEEGEEGQKDDTQQPDNSQIQQNQNNGGVPQNVTNDQPSDLQSDEQQPSVGNMNPSEQNGDMPVGNFQDDGYQSVGGVDNVPMDDNQSELLPDDEVIDVDDLTNSQEETEEKVDGVNTQLLRLLKVVSKYSDAIDRQNQEIADLKDEFEKRNPTEEERLNLRSLSGFPYSEQPKDYWDKKVRENPNYNVIFDNDVPTDQEQKKFDIKKSDLNGMNYREIADSFDEDPQELKKYLNF